MKVDKEIELWFERDNAFNGKGAPRMFGHGLVRTNNRAEFAMRLLDRGALFMGDDDGEDSAGRQKGRRMTAKEIVTLACDVADEAYNEFERRDWMIAVPDKAQIEEILKEQENEKENG